MNLVDKVMVTSKENYIIKITFDMLILNLNVK
jgi:hypothetical protein